MSTLKPVPNRRPDAAEDRKLKLAEAGVVFFLVVGLCVFLGIRLARQPVDETAVLRTIVPATEIVTAPAPGQFTRDLDLVAVVAPGGTEPAGVVSPQSPASSRDVPDIRDLIPGVPIHVTYTSAEHTFFEGRYREAADMFAVYCEQHPANAWGQYMRGLSLWKAGQLDPARDAYNAALGLQPDHLKSLVNLARVELELTEPEAALVTIERALDVAPRNAEALRVLGRVYHQLDRRDQAAAAYLQALHLKSDDPWTLNNLALLAIEAEQFERALAPLARAIALLPDAAVIRNNLATALERTGHLAQAREHYLLAAEQGSGHAEASFARLDAHVIPTGQTTVDLAALATDWSLAATADSAWRDAATLAALLPAQTD